MTALEAPKMVESWLGGTGKAHIDNLLNQIRKEHSRHTRRSDLLSTIHLDGTKGNNKETCAPHTGLRPGGYE
jgi:hypothetical protein